MKCIFCGDKSRVTLTYPSQNGEVKRRRECMKCKERFTTREKADEKQAPINTKKSKDKSKVDNVYDAWYNSRSR